LGHITEDFVSLLLDTRTLKPGDILVKKVRKGIKVHQLVPGSIHLKSELTVTERVNYILDGAQVGVNINKWELDSGELGTLDSIKNEMTLKLRDYFQGKVFTALSTVWTAANTPSNYISMGGKVTAVALENAIDRINQTTSGAKAIVGTRTALTPITKFGAFWESKGDGTGTFWANDAALQEVMATGWLGKYYGCPVIVIPQDYDNPTDYNKLVPEDKILVIGNKVGEFINYGPPMTKMYDDMRPTPPYTILELVQQFGLIVDNADGIYTIGGLS
jgi:hypothetical protein